MNKIKKGQQGLSLMEALVAMLVASIVLAAGTSLVTKALQITDLVTVRSELQQDGRAAINSILKDSAYRDWDARRRCSTAHRHQFHKIALGLRGRGLLF